MSRALPGATPPDWLADVTDVALRRVVGDATFERGLGYLRAGKVRSVSVAQSRSVLGVVDGSAHESYTTVIAIQAPTPGAALQIHGRCTCPVSANCKHVAAVLMAARDKLAARPVLTVVADIPPWQRRLAGVVEPEPEVVEGSQALALQFELVLPDRYGGVERLQIRPLAQGRSGKWIKTGATWRDLEYVFPHQQSPFLRGQRDALVRLLRESRVATSSQQYFGGQERPLHLDEIGDQAWPLLAAACAAGVTLIDLSGRPVRLAEVPAEIGLDVSAADGPAVVTPWARLDGIDLDPAGIRLVGNPASGLFHTSVPGGLLLAPLDRRMPAWVADLVPGGPVVVPAEDIPEFRRGYLRRIGRILPVGSADETLTVPVISAPMLAIQGAFKPDHVLEYAWAFAYREDETEHRIPIGSPNDRDGIRDREAERRLLDALTLPTDLEPTLLRLGLLVPQRRLTGLATAAFVEALGDLAACGVLVELDGSPADYRFVDEAPIITTSIDESGGSDWFNLGVTVTIGGHTVPFAPLFAALAMGDDLLLLDNGVYFEVNRPELHQLRGLIDEARMLLDKPSDSLRLSRYQAALWSDFARLGVVERQSARWSSVVGGLMAMDELPVPEVPIGLMATLRPYQVDGFRWLDFLWTHGMGGILADDMGLGKTLQTLAAVIRAKESGRLAEPALVVAPTSVVSNWLVEAARFAPGLRVVVVEQTQRTSGVELAETVGDADLVVTSYALFRLDFNGYDKIAWSALILDEAQSVKNHLARGYQCARRLSAPVKFAVTGTPLENNLMELWALLSIAAPGLYPDPEAFAQTYRRRIEREGDVDQLATLRSRIRPLMLRRTKAAVAADLPPKQEQVLEVPLSPRHHKIYQTHLQRERQKVLGLLADMDKNRFQIFSSLTLLRRLALDPVLVDEAYSTVGSAKVDLLVERLTQLADEGHRALVFSQFTGFLAIVRRRLEAAGLDYAYLDGSTKRRGEVVEGFKSGTAPVFLISLKAGGFGLNLTEADYCFVLDPWWNPAAELQAIDRTHRIGQTKTVMVYRMVSAETIEEKVIELQQRKRELFAKVIDEGGAFGAGLTVDEIRSLLG